jgi:hypothetical protein
MNVRLLAVAAVVVGLATSCGNSNARITLEQVKDAFARNGLPFGFSREKGAADGQPKHLMGYATNGGRLGPYIRQVGVYDSSTFAKSSVSQWRQHARPRDTVLLAENVVYLGPPSAGARRAMASLRKK